MFSKIRKIRCCLKAGQRLYLTAFIGIIFFYILFAFMIDYAENGKVVLPRSGMLQLLGLFLPFFSVFIALPALNEIWSFGIGEILFSFRKMLYKMIIINDVIYFMGIWGLFMMLLRIYTDILPCYINVLFLCLYLQMIVGVLMPFFRSDMLVIGILVFYLVYSMLCLSGLVGTFTGGYAAGVELELFAFIRRQLWKAICVIAAGVVVGKKRQF